MLNNSGSESFPPLVSHFRVRLENGCGADVTSSLFQQAFVNLAQPTPFDQFGVDEQPQELPENGNRNKCPHECATREEYE